MNNILYLDVSRQNQPVLKLEEIRLENRTRNMAKPLGDAKTKPDKKPSNHRIMEESHLNWDKVF